jgi:hypothetical protein
MLEVRDTLDYSPHQYLGLCAIYFFIFRGTKSGNFMVDVFKLDFCFFRFSLIMRQLWKFSCPYLEKANKWLTFFPIL